MPPGGGAEVSQRTAAKIGRRTSLHDSPALAGWDLGPHLPPELRGHLGGEVALFALDPLAELKTAETGDLDRRA